MVLPFYEYFNPKSLSFGITVDWRVVGEAVWVDLIWNFSLELAAGGGDVCSFAGTDDRCKTALH